MKTIKLNQKSFYIDASVPLVDGDLNAYTIVYPRVPNDQIDGFEVEALRPDGVTVTDLGQVYEDRCEYTLKTNLYSVPGEVRLRVSLLSENQRHTIHELIFEAVPEYDEPSIDGDDRVPVLTQLILNAQQAGDYARAQGELAAAAAADAAAAAEAVGDITDKLDAKADKSSPQVNGGITLNQASPYVKFRNPASGNLNYVELSTTPQGENDPLVLHVRRGNSAEQFDSGRIYTAYDKPTAADVGLGNVDNTADAAKPVSAAVQAALDQKLEADEETVAGWDFAASAASSLKENVPALYAGQAVFSVASNAASKYGYCRKYNYAKLTNATQAEVYIALLPSLENQNKVFTLFVNADAVNGTPLKTVDVTVNQAGYYPIDLTELALPPATEYLTVGFYAAESSVTNALTISVSQQESNEYIYDTETFSTSSATPAWSPVSGAAYNQAFSRFYYSSGSYPTQKLKRAMNSADTEADKSLRVCLASDIHFREKSLNMGVPDDRMALLVDAINAEHRKRPIDFALFNGDLISISSSGIATKLADLRELADKYLSKLEMPWFAIRGNRRLLLRHPVGGDSRQQAAAEH